MVVIAGCLIVKNNKISNDMDKLIAKRERNRLSNEKTIAPLFLISDIIE